MADVDVRGLQRRWEEQGTVAAARDFVRARLRMGALRDGPSPLPEEAFLDGVARRDPAALRAALIDLGGPPELNDFWRYDPRKVLSFRHTPCALTWPRPAGTRAERFVAGWLETLSADELRGLWAVDVMSEPAVTDQERATLRADLRLPTNLETYGVVETLRMNVHYISHGGHCAPPAIARTCTRLLHGLLRRGLVCQAREGSGRAALLDVLCALLDQPAHLERSRPEVEGHGGSEPAARIGILDAFGLRGALAVIAAMPGLAQDERLAASLGRLISGELGRRTVATAAALDLGQALGALPQELALDLLEAAAQGTWSSDSSADKALLHAIVTHGGEWDVSRRWAASEVLQAFAVRGDAYLSFSALVRSQFDVQARGRVAHWLLALLPELLRTYAASRSTAARREAAFLWGKEGRGAHPGFEDVWDRLATDPDEDVRRCLKEGPDPYEYDDL